jgi:hypothetical protein
MSFRKVFLLSVVDLPPNCNTTFPIEGRAAVSHGLPCLASPPDTLLRNGLINKEIYAIAEKFDDED